MAYTVDAEKVNPAASRADAQRGERQGRAYARLGIGIPPLVGGAYAVGFLYGYRAEQRLATANRSQPCLRPGPGQLGDGGDEGQVREGLGEVAKVVSRTRSISSA